MSEDLDALLSPEPGPSGQRAVLLAASTRIVRRGHVVRRITRTAGVALIFALGGGAGWLLKPTTVEREIVQVPAPPLPVPEKAKEIEPVAALSPGDLEIRAELADDKLEIARLYREAGDKYLTVARDYEQAARCYRLHLTVVPAVGRRVAADDSWLLISMKTAISKEKPDANAGS